MSRGALGSNLSFRGSGHYLLLGVVAGEDVAAAAAGCGLMFKVDMQIFQVSPS